MPVDWAVLVGRDARQVQALLLEELDALRAGRTAEQEDALVRALPEPLRAVHLVGTLEVEVSLGSLLGYLGNTAGRHAPLAVDLLLRTGAVRTADVLAQATEADDLHRRLDDYVAAQVQVLAAQDAGGPQAGLDSPIGP